MAKGGTESEKLRPTPDALKELAPTGTLRIGVVSAPVGSAYFVVEDIEGRPKGVTVELGTNLARRLSVSGQFTVAKNAGALVDAMCSGTLDIAFMPIDDERRRQVDFGTSYFIIDSTYLACAGTRIETLADVDRPGVKVIGIAGTATIRSAGSLLKNTVVTAAQSVEHAMEILHSGKAAVLALTRDALPSLASRLPGSRILDGSFMQTGIAIAVPKNRPHALAYAIEFMEDAKASDAVQRAFDHAGLGGLAVAPPSARQPPT